MTIEKLLEPEILELQLRTYTDNQQYINRLVEIYTVLIYEPVMKYNPLAGDGGDTNESTQT